MARAPLLQLSNVSLTFGGDPVFDDLSLIVQPGDRLALVGRNGSGKSTLLKVMAGLVEPDTGTRVVGPGVDLGYMEQDPDMAGHATLGDFAVSALDPGQDYLVERAAKGLQFDPARPVATASGGERRRAALAKLMAEAPQVMLLDEPTNHLDINAIRWLEDHLRKTNATFVLISHDRAFLSALTRATLWIDRGAVRRSDRGFDQFEAWRDKIWEEEDQTRHKLNRKIKAEARWAVEGISARRKRNMGRVRALQELRATRAAQINRVGTAAMRFDGGKASGKKVIEASGLSKAFDDKPIVKGLDLTVLRGDRVAFVGPNGVGKTTLIKMLLGEVDADAGAVKHGTNLSVAVFDQNRSQLNPDQSLWDAMVDDPELGVRGASDQVMVRGAPKHVVGYLKEFLFDEAQARAPVRALSGGEKARLLLARLMARESNLLVLDEPTNDLDIETLDLLQDVLGEYAGTVLLVSHDRDFIDRVATTTIMMDGDGQAIPYAGGWSDMLALRGDLPAQADDEVVRPTAKKAAKTAEKPQASGLSFTERHRLEALPGEIDRLTAEIGKLEQLLADPNLYTENPAKFAKGTEALVARQVALAKSEDEWLTLADKAEN